MERMNTSTRRLPAGLATAAVLLLASGGFASAAPPTPGPPTPSGPTGKEMLSVQPSLISVAVKPGTSTSLQLTLRAAADLDITVRNQGLAQDRDGSFKAVAADQDQSPYTARAMITATPQSLQVKPAGAGNLQLAIAAPPDACAGTRYSIL